MVQKRRKIGIYSGTFDPIHSGHVAFAEEARRLCDLDEIIFLPEQKPRGKSAVTNIAHRVALTTRAIADRPHLRVLHLSSEQFTVGQTLPELRLMLGDHRLTLLIGSDVVRALPNWDGLELLSREVTLAIGIRSGDRPEEMAKIMEQLARTHKISLAYNFVPIPESEAGIASSQIRAGLRGRARLHPEVSKYIQKYRLYDTQETPE